MLRISQAPAALAWCEEITQHLAYSYWEKSWWEFRILHSLQNERNCLEFDAVPLNTLWKYLLSSSPPKSHLFPSSMRNTCRKRIEPRSLSHPILFPWIQAFWDASCSVAGGWGKLWSVHMELLYESYGVPNYPNAIINCELPVPSSPPFSKQPQSLD